MEGNVAVIASERKDVRAEKIVVESDCSAKTIDADQKGHAVESSPSVTSSGKGPSASKIFDNLNYVEAPIPEKNAWSRKGNTGKIFDFVLKDLTFNMIPHACAYMCVLEFDITFGINRQHLT